MRQKCWKCRTLTQKRDKYFPSLQLQHLLTLAGSLGFFGAFGPHSASEVDTWLNMLGESAILTQHWLILVTSPLNSWLYCCLSRVLVLSCIQHFNSGALMTSAGKARYVPLKLQWLAHVLAQDQHIIHTHTHTFLFKPVSWLQQLASDSSCTQNTTETHKSLVGVATRTAKLVAGAWGMLGVHQLTAYSPLQRVWERSLTVVTKRSPTVVTKGQWLRVQER